MRRGGSAGFLRAACEKVVTGAEPVLDLKGASLLVTGGSGFMGQWLAELVTTLNDGYGLGCRLTLLSRRAHALEAQNPQLANRADVRLLQQDILQVSELPGDVTHVIHAAGTADGRLHASDPLAVVRTITQGTQALLDSAARLPRLVRLLHVSSGNVIGRQPETIDGIPEGFYGPLDCSRLSSVYAEAKRFSESLCAIYRSQFRLPIATVRPFAFIGPLLSLDQPWAANSFFREALAGGPIRIHGDGSSVRSYMYPSDMAWWLLNILCRAEPGAVVNVGSPHGVALADLARRISSSLPSHPSIQTSLTPDRRAGVSRLVPDVTTATDGFGLQITVDLDTAISETLRWHAAEAR